MLRKEAKCNPLCIHHYLQVETKLDLDLHRAAATGSSKLLQKILDTGKVHVDCQDEVKILVIQMSVFFMQFTKFSAGWNFSSDVGNCK